MLLQTMSYEEIYDEIKNDSRELYLFIDKQKLYFQNKAKRARRYPFRLIFEWEHPHTHNVYTYFFEIKKHSEWDKAPRLVVYTEYNTHGGKVTVAITREQNINIRICIFRPHFFKRYYERNLSRYYEETPDTERNLKCTFLIHTTTVMSMGSTLASLKEQQKEDPDWKNDSFLTIEGVILCKRNKSNPNIVKFNTFLAIQDLFDGQYEEVINQAIHVFYIRALQDGHQYKKSIDKIYFEGIDKLNSLLNASELPFEEKQRVRIKKYDEVINELYKYIT